MFDNGFGFSGVAAYEFRVEDVSHGLKISCLGEFQAYSVGPEGPSVSGPKYGPGDKAFVCFIASAP